MKYLLLLLPLFTQAQNAPTLSDMLQDRRKPNEVTFLDPPYVSLGIYPGALTTTPFLTVIDKNENDTLQIHYIGQDWCEPFEEFTEWDTIGNAKEAFLHNGQHKWVYAEPADLNNSIFMVETAMICPCGCPKNERQARICKDCLLHQARVRTYGKRPRVYESEYTKLKKKAKQ